MATTGQRNRGGIVSTKIHDFVAMLSARRHTLDLQRPLLPPKAPYAPEYTLVLDLDETLIHFSDKENCFLIRPGLFRFLSQMSRLFEVVVFTAALQDYADQILDQIDINFTIEYRLYRDSTREEDGVYIKDLSRLGRDLSKTLIVDNTPENFAYQQQNGICIYSWYGDMAD